MVWGMKLGHGLAAQKRLCIRAGAVGQKDLALRGAVDGQTGPRVRNDAQAAPRFHLIERDDAAALADREHHGSPGLLA